MKLPSLYHIPLAMMAYLGALPSLKAFEPSLTRLTSKSVAPPIDSRFGNAVAVSDSYFAIGEPDNQAGMVFVYRSSDGRYLRKLQANDRVAGDRFGSAISICGNYIVVGAPESGNEKGAAYVFEASTGRQLRKLTAADGLADTGSGDGDLFGISVSASGSMALIGAHFHDNTGGPANSGAAYLFNISTGSQVAKLTATDASANNLLGISVSLSANLAAVGAMGADSLKGKAYLFDAKSGAQLKAFTASDGSASDQFGRSIALFGNRLVVGAPGNDAEQGAAYLFDAKLGTLTKKYTVPDGTIIKGLGYSLAMTHDLIMVGAPRENTRRGAAYLFDFKQDSFIWRIEPAGLDDDDLSGQSVALSGTRGIMGEPGNNTGRGVAHILRNLFTTKPLGFITAKGETAPGAGSAKFSKLSPPVISGSGMVAYLSTLTGPDAGTGGKATGIWKGNGFGSTLMGRGTASLMEESGSTMTSVKTPIFNDDSDVLFSAMTKTPGVRTDRANILSRSVSTLAPSSMLLTLDSYPGLEGAVVAKFDQTVQDYDFNGTAASAIQLKGSTGRTIPSQDSAIIRVNGDGTGQIAYAESKPAPADSDIRFGQMQPRVGIMKRQLIWGAYLVPGPTTPTGTILNSNNKALFGMASDGSASVLARSGETATTGANYSAFLGASYSYDNQATFKVTLTGSGVTTANNEGIYRYGLGQVLRKGDFLDAAALPGVKINRILKFWSLRFGQVIILAGLQGTGISPANDVALILANPYDKFHILLREGAYTEGTDRAKIGVIQKVDVDPYGSQYVVLASLVSSASTNQALFTGRTTNHAPAVINPLLARAGMRMRKGTSVDAVPYGPPLFISTKITSMSITTTTDSAGVGAKGLGHAVEYQGNIGLTIDYSNGSREIRSGIP